ncbi:MAG: SUMF1/EgtB/PvdO family nonheme iron enzyme, partial [Verrucomicrobiota bacterium]
MKLASTFFHQLPALLAAFFALTALSNAVSAELDAARREFNAFNFQALKLAIRDLESTWDYGAASAFAARLEALESSLRKIDQQLANGTRATLSPDAADVEGAELRFISEMKRLRDLHREALLAHPLLNFDQLLLVRRNAAQLGLPANWQGNASLPRRGFDNEIALLDLRALKARAMVSGDAAQEEELAVRMTTLYKPDEDYFVGDVDLHFEAGRLLFSSIGTQERWQVLEVGVDGSERRQVTPGDQPDVDNYDACYLPDGGILFTSTASLVGVPCVDGSDPVANLFRLEPDGHTIRQLCFDQDHNWSPTLMPDGRVLYQRWEYADTPHSQTRLLFQMNPDGSGQTEFYGSNSYWPNAMFYARPVPDHASRVVAIVSGHHGVPRMGELVLFDVQYGRQEATGVIQRIPGYGRKVEPIIRDQLVDDSWPKFLHPFPLSDRLFLVSAKPTPSALWGIYLVDVFDNMLLLAEMPGYALFEPIPLRATTRPPLIPTRVDLTRRDAVVLLTDIYQGDGLKGVPHGTVKALRIYAYHWSFQGMGGLLGTVGLDGPWDVRRILGTVPVQPDGTAYFRVPANTPISVQPLDAEGKALQLMRSWFTAMPGEHVSCVGCHEKQNHAPSTAAAQAFLRRVPEEITPWYGPVRGFSYDREVQPVIDKFCVGCHNGTVTAQGHSSADLRGTEKVADFHLVTPGRAGKHGGKFSVAYAELHRFVRRPGIESDYHLLAPMEYHADTTELVHMLRKGHHNVRLDAEAWDRLITWIDLNAPFHGSWSEEIGWPGSQTQRRMELRKLYTGMIDPDPECAETAPVRTVPFIAPESKPQPTPAPVIVAGWPFDAHEARKRQSALGAPAKRTIDLGGGLLLELILVPPGEFAMGDGAGAADEQPLTRVRIRRPFWLARTEISNRQFGRFNPKHDSHVESKTAYQFGIHGYPLDKPDQPVVRV